MHNLYKNEKHSTDLVAFT